MALLLPGLRPLYGDPQAPELQDPPPILSASSAQLSAPEAPALQVPNVLGSGPLNFSDRAGISLSGLPEFQQHPFESTGSRVGRGLLSGLAEGFSKNSLLAQGKRQQAIDVANKANATMADHNNAVAMESWKARLADFYKTKQDENGKVIVNGPMASEFGIPVGTKLDPERAIEMHIKAQGDARIPADASLVGGLVGARTITKAQGDYFLKNGWTQKQRDELATKGVPGATAMITVDSANGGLTDKAIDQAAERYWSTGTLPSGMGGAAVGRNNRIMSRAAELHPEGGLATNSAEYSANKSSLQQLTKTYDATTAFSRTAGANLQILMPHLKALADTGSPWLNKPLREIQGGLGDPNVAAFNTAINVVRPEFARILNNPNMVGQYTEGQQREMQHVLDGSATLGQFAATVDVLEKDAANKRTMYAQQIEDIKARIGNSPAPAPSGDVQEWVIGPNGKPVPKGK